MKAEEKYQDFIKKKKRRKSLSLLLQWLALIAILATAAYALVTFGEYQPYQKTGAPVGEDKGFIALSYFGVSLGGDQALIAQDRLDEHLTALKRQGYVTVTQQDIVEYYQGDKQLPERAVFLMFEDGRRDTAIFAQKLLEKLNYKATAFSYAEKFELNDTKFLSLKELLDIEDTSYWELGTNGYRLAFINAFDRYDNYIGQLDPLRYAQIAPYMGRRYNHYLMDYIRDSEGMPKESHELMRRRISYDYEKLRDIYLNGLGKVPGAYVLMHANTGAFGNNPQVSAINEWWIKELFTINFNREGFVLNDRRSSPYDLTRMQPQPWWHTNHLLMRIKYDINDDIIFENGLPDKYEEWSVEKGAAEFDKQQIILTSLPQQEGIMSLKGSDKFQDFNLKVKLTGNKFGQQKLYLRSDRDLTRYIAVSISNNILMVDEKNGAAAKNIFWLDLDKLDGIVPLSVAEDKKAVEVNTLQTFLRYADTTAKAEQYQKLLAKREAENAPSVADGAPEYEPQLPVGAAGNRKLELQLKGDRLTVLVDDKNAVTDLPLTLQASGGVRLASAWGGYGWSQRNLADDVYDGVFEDMEITYPTADGSRVVMFESRLTGWAGFCYQAGLYWHLLIDWFVKYL